MNMIKTFIAVLAALLVAFLIAGLVKEEIDRRKARAAWEYFCTHVKGGVVRGDECDLGWWGSPGVPGPGKK